MIGNQGCNHASSASSFWAEGAQLSALSSTSADGSIDTSVNVQSKSSSRLHSSWPTASFKQLLLLLTVSIHHLALREVKVVCYLCHFGVFEVIYGCGVVEWGRVFWRRADVVHHSVGFLPADRNFIPVSDRDLKRSRVAFSQVWGLFVCFLVSCWFVPLHWFHRRCSTSMFLLVSVLILVASGWEKSAVSLAAHEAFITHWNQRLIL